MNAQYEVRAVPWERGYELHITGPDGWVGCTQSHGMGDALIMVKDYISLALDLPVDIIGITLLIDVSERSAP